MHVCVYWSVPVTQTIFAMTTTGSVLLSHYDVTSCDTTRSDHDYNVAVNDLSVSNVNLVSENHHLIP